MRALVALDEKNKERTNVFILPTVLTHPSLRDGNEWSGPFSDGDEESWGAHPEAMEACGHEVMRRREEVEALNKQGSRVSR